MSQVPPLPSGYRLEDRPDPWGVLQNEGFQATNGYRTDADVEDIRRQGYKPASGGAHNRGDGVDLTHPRLSPQQQEQRLRQLAKENDWGDAYILDEGHHRHLAIPGWGAAPGTPGTRNSGLPDLPAGFSLEKRGSLAGGNFAQPTSGPRQSPPAESLAVAQRAPSLTGQVVDGDTFRLSNGRNGRLLGVDAWEARQTGRGPDNALVPLGRDAADFLDSRVSPETPATFTNSLTYGRPVASLGVGEDDVGQSILRNGHGLAAPEYLKGDPRAGDYMEAERRARLNLLGGHGTNAETPEQFRKKEGPWQGSEPGQWAQGQAIFGDEQTPNYGLRDEVAAGLMAIWRDPKARIEDVFAFANANGFELDRDEARKRFKSVQEGTSRPADAPEYLDPPRPMIDPGDGTVGAAARGVADPINFIDELGGVADTLGIPSPGAGGPRETVWNSDRRFGDILWNNIDQNRDVLAHDDQYHSTARLGGQIAGSAVIPFGAAARGPLALAKVGAVYGGLAGAGAGEGGVAARLPNGMFATALGGAGGAALGLAGNAAVRALRGRAALTDAPTALARQRPFEAAPVLDDGLQSAAARSQAQGGGVAAMRMDDDAAELVSPVIAERPRDYLNVGDLPPLPDGFVLDEPFGASRPMGERLSPEAMARLAEDVDPSSVLPRPSNLVEDLSEAQRANPGPFRELEAPNELDELGIRQITTRKGRTVKIRGPLDLSQRLRTFGGLKDTGGDLASMGITNAPRRMDFGSNEQFLGKLVDDENGMQLDIAAARLKEDGYFRDIEEPTPDDLLIALRNESFGQRHFDPDDLEELANYEGARAQAQRIQQAADEGSPLFEDIGQSITLDDLEANRAPIEAYEDRPRLMGKLGNINLAHLEKPQDVARLIGQIQQRVGGFSAASRGRVTNEETQRLAQEIGLRPEQLLTRRQGQALNAEQLYATRALVQKSRQVVANYAKKAVGGSDEDVAVFRNAWLRHVAIEEQVAGATSEAGRALQQFKMLAQAGDAKGDAVRAYLKGAGGRENIEGAAQAIVDLMEDPAKASQFMREAVKPRWRDKVNELWINSLLSGPKTHVVNFVGNAMTTFLSLPEQAMTAGIGTVLRSADRAYMGEVGARVAGMAENAVDALRAAKRGFITGEPADAVSKVEAANYQAIGGKLGQVIRTPTRALTAADEFWKTINSSAELRALAYRKAASEGGDVQARYSELLRAPSPEMTKQADAAARYYTFQKELGTAGRSVQQLANEAPGLKIILPFVRTPINLLKFAGERSVFAPIMSEVRGALRQGGRARDEALARITLGSGISTAAVMAAMDGKVTGGGPTDPGERAALLQSGWQPYSVRLGDQWVSYQRFDPTSMLIGAAADFAEIGAFADTQERDAFALNLSMAVAKNVTSKTWLSGLSDFFDALSDPERFGPAWSRRLAGSAAVPAIAAQAAQAIDPHLRDARTILDAVKARVPVVSEGLPVRRNVWGEPIKRGASVGPDLISPIYSSPISSDPVKQEVARLRVPLSMPKRFMRVDGNRVDLNPQQFDELVQLSGQPAKSYLDGFVRSRDWQLMSYDERAEFIKEKMKDFRADGTEALKQRYPELVGVGTTRGSKGALPPLPPGFQLQATRKPKPPGMFASPLPAR